MNKGLFIAVEGPDGSGKSTIVPYLVQRLQERFAEVTQYRDPGNTFLGERIRDVLLGIPDDQAKTQPLTELCLFMAARAQLVGEKIQPDLASGRVVVTDRFIWSTYAYQGFGHGLLSSVQEIDRAVLNGFRPDIVVYLDVSLEESVRRMQARKKEFNRVNAYEMDFRKRTFEGYQYCLDTEKASTVRRIAANQSLEAVQLQIDLLVEQLVQTYQGSLALCES